MGIDLFEYQLDAIENLKSGAILCGGVGTGKSRTALTYYFCKECKGKVPINGEGEYSKPKNPKDLYVITTAKKRDSFEWEAECVPFLISKNEEANLSGIRMVVDSWNNIGKYKDIEGAFFIFDEQRVVGYGAWTKAFLKITKSNRWILLSATPGDTWMDYMPVFVANGFYRNKTEFMRRHVVIKYNRYGKFPQIDHYVGTATLAKRRDYILVKMENQKKAEPHHETFFVGYDSSLYNIVSRRRWDPYDEEPIKESGKLCYLMRRVVNSDSSRIRLVKELVQTLGKAIIFYNFDYELLLLRELFDGMEVVYSEWNGKKHEQIPDGDGWVYLVQYSAGAEGWNCTRTNVIIFYSQSYSYRMTVQAAGRIDRINTPYKDLYYYHLQSRAPIDMAIAEALEKKQNFNEKAFLSL